MDSTDAGTLAELLPPSPVGKRLEKETCVFSCHTIRCLDRCNQYGATLRDFVNYQIYHVKSLFYTLLEINHLCNINIPLFKIKYF